MAPDIIITPITRATKAPVIMLIQRKKNGGILRVGSNHKRLGKVWR